MRALLPALLLLPLPLGAKPAPMALGACVETTIARIAGRLEGDADYASGTSVLYANGVAGVAYDRVKDLIRSAVGDPVELCLVELPQGCPPGDDRGKVYAARNLANGGEWEMLDSSHYCGGA